MLTTPCQVERNAKGESQENNKRMRWNSFRHLEWHHLHNLHRPHISDGATPLMPKRKYVMVIQWHMLLRIYMCVCKQCGCCFEILWKAVYQTVKHICWYCQGHHEHYVRNVRRSSMHIIYNKSNMLLEFYETSTRQSRESYGYPLSLCRDL